MTNLFKRLSLSAMAFAITGAAYAAPVLRQDVTVSSAIVTVADMFDGAGALAEEPLFRSPAPGTRGQVPVEDIRLAAARVGLAQFNNPGILAVSVARDGTLVDDALLTSLINQDLARRGILADGMTADIALSADLPLLYASPDQTPVQLVNLRYMPTTGQFSARVMVSGRNSPLDLTGRIDLSVEVPHLKTAMRAGAVIGPDDLEMRPVLLRYAETGDVATFHDIVGMELKRSSREGLMLRPGDVVEPELIGRNEMVTLIYRSGPMTLTVKGRALDGAAEGDALSVLNLMSNKVVTGIAIGQGSVELTSAITTASNS